MDFRHALYDRDVFFSFILFFSLGHCGDDGWMDGWVGGWKGGWK